jgi:hypothetical protein
MGSVPQRRSPRRKLGFLISPHRSRTSPIRSSVDLTQNVALPVGSVISETMRAPGEGRPLKRSKEFSARNTVDPFSNSISARPFPVANANPCSMGSPLRATSQFFFRSGCLLFPRDRRTSPLTKTSRTSRDSRSGDASAAGVTFRLVLRARGYCSAPQ